MKPIAPITYFPLIAATNAKTPLAYAALVAVLILVVASLTPPGRSILAGLFAEIYQLLIAGAVMLIIYFIIMAFAPKN